MVVVWIAVVAAGLGLAVFSSRQTLDAARSLADRLGMSPFLIGMTVVALGTDLPEIGNSITASATGHGDINVGDSVGSALTQTTLVLGLLCFIRRVRTERRSIAVSGFVLVLALLLGAGLLRDGHLGRADGSILLAFWVVGMIAVRRGGHIEAARQGALFDRGVLVDLRDLCVGLGGVALGAVVAVFAFTNFADDLGVPEYATSFLVLSLGTSLPELVVDGRALREGDGSLALGNIIGSSFADATISLGIGPTLFPVAISSTAVRGSVVAAGIVAAALLLLLARAEHDRRSGLALFGLYAIAYVLVVT